MSAFRLSLRVQRTEFSPNLAASQRAKALKAQGVDILDLTLGEPDFETPEHVKAAAIAAMTRGETRYTPAQGIAPLRAAVSAKLERENGLSYPPEQVAVSNGAKQAIYNAFAATLDAGDEVIVPAPYYPSFPEIVRLNDGHPVIVPTSSDKGFKLTPEALEAAITPRTRWLVINSPGNPSGAVYRGDELAALAEVLRRHPQVLVLLDEVYEHILFVAPSPHFLHVAPDLRERTLVVNGVSKTYAMTGWRVGFAAGPAALIKAMGIIQSQSVACVSSISQAAAIAALEGDQSFVPRHAATYKERRDILVDGLSPIKGIDVASPDGGFFIFAGCGASLGKTTADGRTLTTDSDFVTFLLDTAGVASVAGASFGLPGYFRLSIAVSTEQIAAAPGRIAKALATLR
jgi:aspartate aminotransferase